MIRHSKTLKKTTLLITITIAPLLSSLTAQAKFLTPSGKVIKVSDGDTITVLQDKRQIKVRLYGIDAPELKQPYGKKSKQFLSNLITGKIAEVKNQK